MNDIGLWVWVAVAAAAVAIILVLLVLRSSRTQVHDSTPLRIEPQANQPLGQWHHTGTPALPEVQDALPDALEVHFPEALTTNDQPEPASASEPQTPPSTKGERSKGKRRTGGGKAARGKNKKQISAETSSDTQSDGPVGAEDNTAGLIAEEISAPTSLEPDEQLVTDAAAQQAEQLEAQRKEAERLANEQAVLRAAEIKAAQALARAQQEAEDAAREQREAAQAQAQEAERLETQRLENQRLADEERAQAQRAAEAAAQAAREAAAAAKAEAEQREAQRLELQKIETKRLEEIKQRETERLAQEALQRQVDIKRQAQEEAAALLEQTRQAAQPLDIRRAPQDTLVMVADDSKVVRVKTSRLLAQHHYRVVLAEDGEDARRKMEIETPHVLITDVEMPGLDGFELTRHVRNQPQTAHIPIIMITSADDRLKAAADEAGVTFLLGKPYSEAALIEHIEQSFQAQTSAIL